jgi:hypothetical protein
MQGRLLQIILRVGGAVMLLAVFAIFMPTRWMAATNDWLGLEEFPASPLVDYLTRSLSMMYALQGGLLILLSFDLKRYRPVLLYVSITTVVGGLLLTGIDLHAGLPPYWTLTEGPPITVLGLLLVWLVRRIPQPPPE